MARFQVPCTSPAVIESKSFKLYLNSFNQTRFGDNLEVIKTLEADLSLTAGATVLVNLCPLIQMHNESIGNFNGECLDGLDVEIDYYQPEPGLLTAEQSEFEHSELLYSNLLRSRCPVTGQPDWGSVFIQYRGNAINKLGLLKYIISYREHQSFHEQCVERMFLDIFNRCRPRHLTVYARYLRRGGLDINPYRSNTTEEPVNIRLLRQ